jgi:hypothetical protein
MSGYECVEVLRDYCEVGRSCPDRGCPFAFGAQQEAEAESVFRDHYDLPRPREA